MKYPGIHWHSLYSQSAFAVQTDKQAFSASKLNPGLHGQFWLSLSHDEWAGQVTHVELLAILYPPVQIHSYYTFSQSAFTGQIETQTDPELKLYPGSHAQVFASASQFE